MTLLFRSFSILSVLLLGLGCVPATPSKADATDRQITVTGTGIASATPDMASINVGVTTNGGTAEVALKQNSERMQEILIELKSMGIAEKDIQTSNFSVRPRFLRPPRGSGVPSGPPKIVGYAVSNAVSVVVRDLKILGPVLDQLVGKGANAINNLSFDLSEPQPVHERARRNAVKDATAKARLFAEEAGVSLGRVLSIREQQGARPVGGVARARLAEADSSVPIAAGDQAVTMSVSMTFELKD